MPPDTTLSYICSSSYLLDSYQSVSNRNIAIFSGIIILSYNVSVTLPTI